MAENKLHVRGHYSEKEINDKLEWSISLLHELVVSIDDIDKVGHTLPKAERLDAALAKARDALGLPPPPVVDHGLDLTPVVHQKPANLRHNALDAQVNPHPSTGALPTHGGQHG